MPYEISIPDTVKTGGVLEVTCVGFEPNKTAFAAILGKNPRTGKQNWHGRELQNYITADWIQAEQENSHQEGVQHSLNDGVIHFELKAKDGSPLPTGQYAVHAVAYSNTGQGKADVIKIVTLTT